MIISLRSQDGFDLPRFTLSDSSTPCGIFIRDSFNKEERKKIVSIRRSGEALGYTPQDERREGCIVYLQVTPAMHKPKTEFVDSRNRWACETDIALTGGSVYGDYLLTALELFM
ncbi:hypothetical protein VTL71DRAFT_10946 [Oculimacula yallundae]|uniref:Uncharacterized protein n=1 Tax=Oculimacula yallundae TaxID=86028 RepID=A0ABR4CUR3_9HELO